MPEDRLTLADAIASRLVSGLLHLIALLPLGVSQLIGRLIGRCIYWSNSRAAKVTATNIALCLPQMSPREQKRLARESLQHTGQMIMESPAAWLGAIDRISAWIREIRNESLVNDAIEAGQGLIVMVPHIGNWELINVYFAMRSPELGDLNRAGLYAPPGKPYMRGIMAEIRGRFGNDMVPTTTRGLVRMYRCMEDGGIAVILPDQVPAHGQFAPFFGHDCLTDRLISRLISKTGARVICCVIERLPGARGFRIVFSEPDPQIYAKDLAASLEGLNKSVENCVHQAMPQYQWEYKRFKERPVGKLRIYNYDNEPWTHH